LRCVLLPALLRRTSALPLPPPPPLQADALAPGAPVPLLAPALAGLNPAVNGIRGSKLFSSKSAVATESAPIQSMSLMLRLAVCFVLLALLVVPGEGKFQEFNRPNGRGFQEQGQIPGINDGGDPRKQAWVDRERKKAFGKKDKGKSGKGKKGKRGHGGL
jgi:hypothetical protein